jgi:hypothetical protein
MFPKTTIPRPSHGGSLIGVCNPRSPGNLVGRGGGGMIVGGRGATVGGVPGTVTVAGGGVLVTVSGGRDCNVSDHIELG